MPAASIKLLAYLSIHFGVFSVCYMVKRAMVMNDSLMVWKTDEEGV